LADLTEFDVFVFFSFCANYFIKKQRKKSHKNALTASIDEQKTVVKDARQKIILLNVFF